MRPFVYRLRVRYHECDGQKVVFNARYAEYLDIAALEYCRSLFGGSDAASGGMDWRLVKQTMEWKTPARFDDVLEVELSTARIGTTSFALAGRIVRPSDGATLTLSETVYVTIDEASETKVPITGDARSKLEAGAPGTVVDCSGAR
jgi:acyl-CoA thioester hydrolase